MTETATYRELRRSRSDRMIAGVSGGLGAYFNVNPLFYRIGFVVLTLLGGAGILIYGACALVIPNEGDSDSIAGDIFRNHRQRPVATAGLLMVAAAGIVLLSHLSFRFHSNGFWIVVLIVGGLLLWLQRRPAVAVEPTAGATTVESPPTNRGHPILITISAIIAALLLALAVFVAVIAGLYAHLGKGVGDRNYEPVAASALRDDYQVGVGTLDLDLSRVALPPGTTTIHVAAGIGDVRVIVPSGVTVRAKAHVNWGDTTLLGHEEDGHNVHADVGPSDARLVLDTHVGIGQVEVQRSVR